MVPGLYGACLGLQGLPEVSKPCHEVQHQSVTFQVPPVFSCPFLEELAQKATDWLLGLLHQGLEPGSQDL